MLSLFLKSLLGAAAVLVIAFFSKSRVFYIAGLVPLFPTFALIAHVIVAQEKGAEALRQTALFAPSIAAGDGVREGKRGW